MTIASEITRINNNIASAYTAASGKGATLPATQNSANLATCINSITGGGGSKYGATAGSFLGDVDIDGILQAPSSSTDLVFTGVEDMGSKALYYRFYYNPAITSVSFPDLTTISGNDAMIYAFNNCSILTSISFPELTIISGNDAMYYAFRYCSILTSASFPELTTISGTSGLSAVFQNCTSLASLSLPKLTTVSGDSGLSSSFNNCSSLITVSLQELTTISGIYGLSSAFNGCTSLTSLSLPKLTTLSGNNSASSLLRNTAITTMSFPVLSDVSGSSCLQGAFQGCQNLTDIYFNALTTSSFGSYVNQFNNMFNSGSSGTGATSGAFTVHFPSNLQSTISGLTGYPTFGADSARITLLYDLSATS